MISLEFTIEGEKQLSRNLLNVGSNMQNLSRPFKDTGDYVKKYTENDVFNTQGASNGNPWEKLSPEYAIAKSKKYSGKGILEASGRMRNSFYYDSGRDYVIIGNKTDYFKYHQSNKARSKLPRRVMLKLTQTLRENIVRIFNTYIKEILK